MGEEVVGWEGMGWEAEVEARVGGDGGEAVGTGMGEEGGGRGEGVAGGTVAAAAAQALVARVGEAREAVGEGGYRGPGMRRARNRMWGRPSADLGTPGRNN